MTIAMALDLVDQLKPNMMSPKIKINFLQEIDQMIWRELVMTHWHTMQQNTKPEYTQDTDPGTELLIPAPYDKLYRYWLMCQIDEMNQEMDKWNNDRALFDNAYEEMSDWYTRTHLPIQKTREFRL